MNNTFTEWYSALRCCTRLHRSLMATWWSSSNVFAQKQQVKVISLGKELRTKDGPQFSQTKHRKITFKWNGTINVYRVKEAYQQARQMLLFKSDPKWTRLLCNITFHQNNRGDGELQSCHGLFESNNMKQYKDKQSYKSKCFNCSGPSTAG